MGTVIGRDYNGNSVQFEHDTRPVEADSALLAETALHNNATSTAFKAAGLASLLGGLSLGGGAALVAGTTQTLAGATALRAGVSVVNAANASDGVKFNVPASGSGRIFIVISVGSTATVKVWPNLADAIDGGTAGAGVTLTSAHRVAVFIDSAVNNWTSALLGAVAS